MRIRYQIKICLCAIAVFICTGKNIYAEDLDFNYKVKATAVETVSYQETILITKANNGSNIGSENIKGTFNIAVGFNDFASGGPYSYEQRVWSGIDISYEAYDLDFVEEPELSVSISYDYQGLVYDELDQFLPDYSLEVYAVTKDGFKAKVWVPYDIDFPQYNLTYDWIWEPTEITFNWSATGEVTKPASIRKQGTAGGTSGDYVWRGGA